MESGEEAPSDIPSQLNNLKKAFIKVATMSGHGNNLGEFGFKMWTPEPKDMKKYTG